MSNTPRTFDMERLAENFSPLTMVVNSTFAKQLERELNEAGAKLDKCVQADPRQLWNVATFEMAGQRDELADILRLLHDSQNGCPLEKYKKDWSEAMTRAEAILERLGK